MRALLMLFSLTLAWNACAQLPSQPLQKANFAEQPTKSDQRGTEQSPIVIKVIPPLADDKKSAEEKKEKQEKSESDWWLVKLTGVLAVIGAFQLIVFSLQAHRLRQTIGEMKIATKATEKAANAAERTVKTMEDTAKRELRAYVHVVHVAMVNAKRDGFPKKQVHIEFKNFGQTPAKNIRIWREMDIRELTLASNLGRSTTRTVQHGVLGPSDIYRSIQDVPLLGGGEEVHERKKALYIWGEFRYVDAFDDERITHFQYMVAGAGWLSDGELYVCEVGNDAT